MRPMRQPIAHRALGIAKRLGLSGLACAAFLVVCGAASPVMAQVGPSPAESAQYRGLHAAALAGDVQRK